MKKRILIVDDEEGLTRVIKLNLEKLGGYEVRIENKSVNALRAARDFRPDLILLDVMMPELDGGAVADQVKADETLKNTPIIFLTAAVAKDELGAKGGVIAGHPFIAKPVNIQELEQAIVQYLP